MSLEKHILDLIEKEDIDGLHEVYRFGNNVNVNISYSWLYWTLVKRGDRISLYILGDMYQYGKYVKKTFHLACQHYLASGKKGNGMAYKILGDIARKSYPKNNQKAYEYYRKSMENGCVLGEYEMEKLRQKGIKV